MGKTVSTIMFALLLASTLALAFNTHPVNAIGTVYIRADGSVDPPWSLIQRNGDYYTLTGNITSDADGIKVEKDNVTVDGAGYTLQGSGVGCGFNLTGINLVTIKNTKITSFECGIWLYSSSNNSVSGNNIANNYAGIFLFFSSNGSVSGNNIANNGGLGIFLVGFSNNNSIARNNITANKMGGIRLAHSSNNSIVGNNIAANNGEGVYLWSSSNYNTVSENNIAANNGEGVYPDSSFNNTVTENNITNNDYGVYLGSSSFDNELFHNNFIDNAQQVYVDTPWTANIWDDGYPSGGNYWSDYAGVDADNDGIGDSPYTFDANDTDRYPLMGMFSDFEATSEYRVQTICNSSISSFQYNGTSIRFDVTGKNGTTGFCRICIPTALMNDTYHIFVNGTETSCTLLPCSNATHSYLYFDYDLSASKIQNRVLLRTTMGDIIVELYDDMPITTANFINLTRMGIYDSTIFHRVIENFVIQGGDPTGTGLGDPSIPPILDELPNRHSNVRGSVAMAKTNEPNSATSQFYINLVNNSYYLDPAYVVFGKVIEGMDVVDMISKVQTDTNDRPLQNVTVLKAEHIQYSTSQVVIIPELPSFIILPLFMIAMLLAVIGLQRKTRAPKKRAREIT